jgi:hypothetical protein
MSGSIRIEVHARDVRLLPDIFGYNRTIGVGSVAEVGDGVTIRDDGSHETRALDIPAIMHFTLEVGERSLEAIGTGYMATWLYDKVKGRIHPERRDEKLVIEHTEVELDEGAIKRIITEKLTSEKKG